MVVGFCVSGVGAQTYDLKASIERALEIHPGVQAAQGVLAWRGVKWQGLRIDTS